MGLVPPSTDEDLVPHLGTPHPAMWTKVHANGPISGSLEWAWLRVRRDSYLNFLPSLHFYWNAWLREKQWSVSWKASVVEMWSMHELELEFAWVSKLSGEGGVRDKIFMKPWVGLVNMISIIIFIAPHPIASSKEMATNLSGYDCKFVSEPAHTLKCLICLSVARDPRQHEACGKLFCSQCIEEYGRDKPCPNCKTTGSQFFIDHKSTAVVSYL